MGAGRDATGVRCRTRPPSYGMSIIGGCVMQVWSAGVAVCFCCCWSSGCWLVWGWSIGVSFGWAVVLILCSMVLSAHSICAVWFSAWRCIIAVCATAVWVMASTQLLVWWTAEVIALLFARRTYYAVCTSSWVAWLLLWNAELWLVSCVLLS